MDLINHEWELPIGVDLLAREVGNHLLVRWPQEQVSPATILESKQIVKVFGPASGLLPQACRMYHRHGHLLTIDRIHLITDEVHDLADNSMT